MAKVLEGLTPDEYKEFLNFSSIALAEGALTSKEKSLIAVAVATVKKCSNSLAGHTKLAKAEDVSLQELLEASFVVAAVEAGGAVTHSTNMHNAIDDDVDDVLYKKSNLEKLTLLNNHASQGFKGYLAFNKQAMKVGQLSLRLKEIIAVAVAHATLCPYCIDVHTRNAIKEGATMEELSEAVIISTSVLSGSIYSQMEEIIKYYDE